MKRKTIKYALALLVLSCGLFTAQCVNAQAPYATEFSSGVKVLVPIGKLKETNAFGLGFDLQGEVPISRTFTVIGNTAFTFLLERDNNESEYESETLGFIPFLAGARYYVSGPFFIGAQAGYAMYQNGFLKGPTTGGFSYAPQIGFNGPKTGLYFYYSGTSLRKETEFLPTGTIGHIGGALTYRF